MFGIHDLALFIISGFLLNVMPGPDSLLIMSKSASQGWRAGSVASLGIGSGILVHVFAAAVGLSAILASSATAFTVVKYVGAAYLIYIGIIVLGAIFNVNSMLWCHFLAIFTAFASKRLKVSKSMSVWLNKTIGVLFILLGMKLALAAKIKEMIRTNRGRAE